VTPGQWFQFILFLAAIAGIISLFIRFLRRDSK